MVLNQCDGVVSETIWHLNGEAIKISAVRCRFRQREPLTTVAMREVALFVTLFATARHSWDCTGSPDNADQTMERFFETKSFSL